MAPIGSTVIWMGKVWVNQFHGVQPVWEVKEPSIDDERQKLSTKAEEPPFEELLKEAIKQQKKEIAL